MHFSVSIRGKAERKVGVSSLSCLSVRLAYQALTMHSRQFAADTIVVGPNQDKA
jgi:hypothetical protein